MRNEVARGISIPFRNAKDGATKSARYFKSTLAKRQRLLYNNIITTKEVAKMAENRYDVFISFKNRDANGNPSRDSEIAKDLFDEFTKQGISAFFANVKLLELGSAAYKSSIEKAMDAARIMVVIGTDPAYLETEWVTYERESFHNDILSGLKKNACIIPYLATFESAKIPRSLRGYETFFIENNSVADVVRFAEAFLKRQDSENAHTEQHETQLRARALTTGKSVSAYKPDYGKEFRRLRIQARNTKPADTPAINYVLEKLNKKDVKILDAGCAYGFVTKDRFGGIEGAFTVGVDINEKCLEYARQNNAAPNLVYESLQFETDDFEDNLQQIMDNYNIESFDIIFASLVIHHLKNPNKFLKRIRKFLSKDGYIIVRGSDDGSVISVNDDGLIQKIIDLHLSTEGVSDRLNGRKIYSQLIGSGYKNVKMMNYVKEISGLDIDERNEVFEERFAYRRNYLKMLCDKYPYDMEKKNNLEYMDFALECLENKFCEDQFWYCEIDFVGIAQKK